VIEMVFSLRPLALEAYTNLERFLDRDVVVRLTVAFALNTPDRDVSTTIW
jgi:hypothetical protein